MAGFSENALSKKLADLNNSQQSIQTLSLWLIHHRKHHAAIVKVWYKELLKAKEHRKLTFMYLANDVIQNSKKKGPEFGKEYGGILKKAFEHMGSVQVDDKTKKGLSRLLHVWEERGVYEPKLIKELKKGLDGGGTGDPPKKKPRIERVEEEKVKERVRKKSETEVEVEIDGTKELHVTLSPRTPAGDPPEPEELVRALMDLENSASSDAAVRERIASLPPEVSEVSLLSKLQDKASAEKLAEQVNEAVQLLTEYNTRLSAEMEDRKKLGSMLQDYVQAQKDLLMQAEERLEEYKEKLLRVYQVRQELKSHVQNLPDLTKLPDVTGGLAPLPSAGDLFSI